jgi:hypothetical protein
MQSIISATFIFAVIKLFFFPSFILQELLLCVGKVRVLDKEMLNSCGNKNGLSDVD